MGVSEYLGLMPATVTVEAWTGQDGYGEATYAAGRSHRARIEIGTRGLKETEIRELKARGRVFLATTAPPSVKDRLTLPSPYDPPQPPILDVRPVEDEGGIHHCVIIIG